MEKGSTKEQERLERKLRFASEEPDSIFMIPFAKPNRYAMVNMTRDADRLIAGIKRKAGFGLDFTAAKKLLAEFDKISEQMWEYVRQLSPRLHSFDRRRWRDLNNTREEKTNLAHRRASYPLIPRSEESGEIAMAVKLIEQRNFEVRETAAMDDLETIVENYVTIMEGLDALLEKASEATQIEYRSPLPSSKQPESPEDASREEKTKKPASKVKAA